MKRVAAAWGLVAADVAIVAVTNADALVDDVHEALPWTDGGFCDIWSGRFFVLTIALSVPAVALAVAGGREPGARRLEARAATVVAGLLVVYWVALAFLKTMSMCVE